MRITESTLKNEADPPPQLPRETAHILQRLARLGLKSLVVAKGQYSPYPRESERVLFFAEKNDRLKPLLDTWLPPRVYQAVLDALPAGISVAIGSCSAMALNKPAHVWASKGRDLHLWKRGRLVGKFGSQHSELRCGWTGKWRSIPNAELSCAHGFLSPNWLQRGVKLCRKDGQCYMAAHARDPIVFIDPTYDNMDLVCDASWVPDLAKSVAFATGLAVQLDFPLT